MIQSVIFHFLHRHISREPNHRDTAQTHCVLHRNLQDSGHLTGGRNDFAIMTALGEQQFRMRLLEITCPDFAAGYMGCDSKDWGHTSMGVIKTINEMKV